MASNKRDRKAMTESRDEYIAEALRNKRKATEQEMVHFRALKEQEFRAFEAYLRYRPGEPTVAAADAHVDSLGLRYKIKRPKSPKTAVPRKRTDESILADPMGHAGFIGEGTLGWEKEAAMIRREARLKAEEKKEQEAHEREREFLGVVTPSYLPLLDGRTEKENEEPKNSLERSSLEQFEGGKSVGFKNKGMTVTPPSTQDKEPMDSSTTSAPSPTAASTLSSSVESLHNYIPPPMISPPATQTRPLSPSVPSDHQHDLDRRRSSSRSDASINSLRSSLKDPSQPKSPKRVQFSIDNTVVSPSTSPLASRASASKGTSSNDGKERFEVVKGKREGKSSANGPVGDESQNSSSSSQTVSGSLGGMPSFGSYFQSKRAENTDTPPSTAEDFDIVNDEEDVFEFDEDIASKESGNKNIDKDDEGDETMLDDDLEGPVGSQAPLTGSSPHAGSLPIEIKMPVRRGREADDG